MQEAIIGFAFGLGIMVMIFATSHNNAGQLNPAVTIGLVAAGVSPILQALLNIVAQARSTCNQMSRVTQTKCFLLSATKHTLYIQTGTRPEHQKETSSEM